MSVPSWRRKWERDIAKNNMIKKAKYDKKWQKNNKNCKKWGCLAPPECAIVF